MIEPSNSIYLTPSYNLYYNVDAQLRRVFDTSIGLFVFDAPSVLDVSLINVTYYNCYRYGSNDNYIVFHGNLIGDNNGSTYSPLLGLELTGGVNPNSGYVYASHSLGVPY